MHDLVDRAGQLAGWLEEGRRAVAATLVALEGSGPLGVGTTMLVADDGAIEGSVTGGCVEGAVVERAQRILAGAPPELASYGISDELGATVGLTCGGTVEIFVREIARDQLEPLRLAADAAARGAPAALATVLDGPAAGRMLALADGAAAGGLDTALLARNVAADLGGALEAGAAYVATYGEDGARSGDAVRVHLQPHAAPPRMLVFGANDFSAALAPAAAALGFAVTICDAREPFLRSPRYARHAETAVAWPQELLAGLALGRRDAVLVLTHDPKFDEPALIGALASGAGYVGALGSRRTTADRAERLRAAGVAEDELARVYAPCGLDVGAATPAEAAVAILAEVVAARTGRAGGSLRAGDGVIRPRAALPAPSAAGG